MGAGSSPSPVLLHGPAELLPPSHPHPPMRRVVPTVLCPLQRLAILMRPPSIAMALPLPAQGPPSAPLYSFAKNSSPMRTDRQLVHPWFPRPGPSAGRHSVSVFWMKKREQFVLGKFSYLIPTGIFHLFCFVFHGWLGCFDHLHIYVSQGSSEKTELIGNDR